MFELWGRRASAAMCMLALLIVAAGVPAGAEDEPETSADSTLALLAQEAIDRHPDAIQPIIDDPTFGGIWINDSGQLVVAFTESPRDSALAAIALLDEVAEVVIVTVEIPFTELWRIHDAIMSVQWPLEGVDPPDLQVWSAYIDEVNNQVLIKATHDSAEAHAEIAEMLGTSEGWTLIQQSAIPVIDLLPAPASAPTHGVFDPILNAGNCVSRDACNPLRSGLQVNHVDDGVVYTCTSGFTVRHPAGKGILTAGHCADRGVDWYHGPHLVGPTLVRRMSNYTDMGWVDAEYVQLDSFSLGATNRQYLDDDRKSYRITDSGKAWKSSKGFWVEEPINGAALCFSGATSREADCGAQAYGYETMRAVIEGFNNNEEIRLVRVGCSDVIADEGDSGGGMVRSNTALAIYWGAMIRGGCGGMWTMPQVFTPMHRAELSTNTKVIVVQ